MKGGLHHQGHCLALASNPSETGAMGPDPCSNGIPLTSVGMEDGLEGAGWKWGCQGEVMAVVLRGTLAWPRVVMMVLVRKGRIPGVL